MSSEKRLDTMRLFERIDFLVKNYTGSRAKLAKRLGVGQTTFNGYFSVERQKNFWEILPEILKEFPFISREWLYFGEGEMLKADEYNELKQRIERLERQVDSGQAEEAKASANGVQTRSVDFARNEVA